MGKILLVNTGPTEYERCGPYPLLDCAGLDAPACDWAQAAVQRLREYRLAAVYYLPVPSAAETAVAIAQAYSLAAQVLPGFEGAGQMQWKGLSPEEASVLDCPLEEKEDGTRNIKFPFAADPLLLRQRIARQLDGIAEKYTKETVAVVSHRALSVFMVLHFLHMSNSHYNQIAQECGAVSLFEMRGGVPSALYINDICHLKNLL